MDETYDKNEVYAILMTCKRFQEVGIRVFHMNNTFYGGGIRDKNRLGMESLGLWLEQTDDMYRDYVQKITFAWRMLPRAHRGIDASWLPPVYKAQQVFFDTLKKCKNLTTLNIVTTCSAIGHTVDTDPEYHQLIQLSHRVKFSKLDEDRDLIRIWMEDILGAQEVKGLKNLKKVVVRGDDQLSGLALREFSGGPAIPSHIKANQAMYGWQEDLAHDGQAHPYGTMNNKIVFTI